MTSGSSAELPLSGIRVLDFTHAAAGPYATMLMADLGAEVIKIEKPGRGDGARFMGEPMLGPQESDYYVALNRNKRGLALDVSTLEGREIARQLAERCDVVVQNFRPGVMDRLGLGFEELSKRSPGLVYGSVSAFGSTGPMSSRPANDIIMQSVSGLMGVTGEADGGPVRIGAPVSDFATGLFSLVGILAALRVRDEHPEGQHVETSMLDSSIALMANYIPAVVALEKRIPRLGRGHAQIVPYQAFECADGQFVMVGAFTNGFWRRLCDAVEHPEWSADPRFESNAKRLENRADLLPQLTEIFRERDREEWLRILDGADVPNSPVLELHETLQLDQVVANETIVDAGPAGQPIPTVRCPTRSSAWPAQTPSTPPAIGEHSFEILSDLLGMDADVAEKLVAGGVTSVPTQAPKP